MSLMDRLKIVLLYGLAIVHAGTFAFGDGLLFSGHTENGWQIFAYNLKDFEITQITVDIGDKRIPSFNASTRRVYFKDSNGRIQFIGENGKSGFLLNAEAGCSSYVISPQGDTVYFTRLATGNTQRQFIWKAEIGSEDELVPPEIFWRPDVRSARQLAINASGDWMLATHIKSIDTEQILKLPLDMDSAPQYITSASDISVYPVFSSDSSGFYFSKRISEKNFDLFFQGFTNSKEINLSRTPDQSEFGASIDPESGIIFCEVRKGMGSEIHRIDREKSSVSPLSIDFPACEPYHLSSEEFRALREILNSHNIHVSNYE